MPKYIFNPSDMEKNRILNPKSYRNMVTTFISAMNNQLGSLAEALNDEDYTGALDILTTLQQTTIDLGNYTELVKGEGYDIVSALEQFCEDIYEMYEPLSDFFENQITLDEARVENAYGVLDQRFAEMVNSYDAREEVVFFCLKPDYFKDYRSLYDSAIADPNKDVLVIPIPFAKRNLDGTIKETYFSAEGYPEDVKVYDCQKYDISLHEPETIVIQYPQDGYNDVAGIPAAFYSLNLRKYTDKLILIPYKEPDDFDENEFRPYYNMNFYVTQPGVMCADEVWLYSEKLRGLYIKKLVEFAGEETRSVWEDKIKVVERPKNIEMPILPSEIRMAWNEFRSGLGDKWINSTGKNKKIILYQPVFSSFVEYGEEMLDKIKRNLQVFYDNRNEVILIWLEQLPLKRDLSKINADVATKYRKMVEDFVSSGEGIFISDFVSDNEYQLLLFLDFLEERGVRKGATLERIAIEISDAYYGDGDYVARQFTLEKKPVMIQNVEI